MRASRADLRAIVEAGVRAAGFELVHVELGGRGRLGLLRVYIDSPGGVGVDDCATVSRQLSAVLDVEDLLPGQYVLEVSSPGLDRPLVRVEDFERFAGRTVKLRTLRPLEGRRNFTGRIAGTAGDHVLLDVDHGRIDLPFELIDQARLVPEL